MPIEDEGQNKINKLTEKLSTEGINSTTIKQIDTEMQTILSAGKIWASKHKFHRLDTIF
ncbi:ATP-binding protein [Orientia tsutsugamushi str. Gilliam]|uniref:ATP-binding protein n=1 Tax=Orientia tsutsugamushi str. Gilliam TaxID=1359184 RepID=A0A2U3QQP1_ORITS|nr:hypothetical protein [Orientia tsutsugamushi]SPR03256.1 ATP-binding protein [Orientia tsutsugamushi str. Gilliam]